MNDSSREAALAALLARAGFAGAERAALPGDASTRRYERLSLGGRRAILMDAPRSAEAGPCPPGASPAERRAMGWNATARLAASRVEAFVAVGEHLRGLGLSAPEVFGVDFEAGYAVLEDLGEQLFVRAIAEGAEEEALYAAAGELLFSLHAAPIPDVLSAQGAAWPILDYDALALEAGADLFFEWLPRVYETHRDADAAERWARVRDSLIVKALGFPRAFTLRDYHAENLLWLPEREGAARIGLLDYQDAVRGWRAWDFSMLVHDARRDVSPRARAAAIGAYLAASGADEAAFMRELSVLGALNCLRILGVFSRLSARDGKHRYLGFMPRMWAHLDDALSHPALAEARAFVEEFAPGGLLGRARWRTPDHAMVLAAGMGTRMRPLTDHRPKPLVEVGGKALIDHMLDRLAGVGVERAVVNVHHFADMLEAHLAARAARGQAPSITISDERAGVLETGGGLKRALPLLGPGPCWVANIDSVWIEDGVSALGALAAAWDPGRMDVLLLLAKTRESDGFHASGDVFLESDGRVRFKAAGEDAPYVYVGVHVCDPAFVSQREEEKFSLLPLWKDLAERGRIHGVSPPGHWMHVGDPGARDSAQARLAARERSAE